MGVGPAIEREGGIHAFNDIEWHQLRSLALEDMRVHFPRTHRRLLDFLPGVREHLFAREGRVRRRLRSDTYMRKREHTSQATSSHMANAGSSRHRPRGRLGCFGAVFGGRIRWGGRPARCRRPRGPALDLEVRNAIE